MTRMKKPHILVVEDESHLAVGIKFNLEREGYRVTTVGDGPSALEVVNRRGDPVDVIVLDLMLPKMSGYAVCESLRASGNATPVLILTARTLTEDRIRGFDVGANQYLTKPFDLGELLSRVRNLLAMTRRPPVEPEREFGELDTVAFGDARIDFRSFEARVGDQGVRLTRLEMRLLQYFAEHPGRVVSRAELLERVWNTSSQVTTRAVDQFVMRLRKAFEPDSASPRYFLTVRDAGYRFDPEGRGPAPE